MNTDNYEKNILNNRAKDLLASPLCVANVKFSNRVVLQPMEGCDCNEDGSPSELTVKKYMSAARSGAGCVWFEANAACSEGRTNLRQMMLTRENLPCFKALLTEMRRVSEEECGVKQVYLIQLTHSGRQSIAPMIAYRNRVYEERRPVGDENIVTDEYLDTLPEKFAESARLAVEAGFDGVDVKSCHGYLFQELLSAYSRDGRYGGSLENRMRLYLGVVEAVRKAVGEKILLTTRLSVSDMVEKPYGFGTTENNELDMREPDMLIERLVGAGIQILNVTVGNPYYNPHINRPYRKGGYTPPESASEGLKRFEYIEKHVKEKFPELCVVGSGMSYHRGEMFEVGQRLLSDKVCDLVGFGRMWLAYPEFYRDFTKENFDDKKCCLTCSKCTELMRAKEVSGCAVFNEYYRELYKKIQK